MTVTAESSCLVEPRQHLVHHRVVFVEHLCWHGRAVRHGFVRIQRRVDEGVSPLALCPVKLPAPRVNEDEATTTLGDNNDTKAKTFIELIALT